MSRLTGIGLIVCCAAVIAGCGAYTHRAPAHPVMYLNNHGAQRGGLIARRVNGVNLVLPTALGSGPLHVLAPPELAGSADMGSRGSEILDSTNALIVDPQQVELIAQGSAGKWINLFWEMSCGYHQVGSGPADFGGEGGMLAVTGRLPLVVRTPLPAWDSGIDACYVALTASTVPGSPSPRGNGVTLSMVNH